MTGSSSTWMLPLLLLPLFISFLESKPVNYCRGMHDLTGFVNKLGEHVKNCSENCSSVPITDKRCMCFNLSMSQGEDAILNYFITGLRSLHNISNQNTISNLEKTLGKMKQCERLNFSSLIVKYEPVISPKSFVRELENLRQQINTALALPS